MWEELVANPLLWLIAGAALFALGESAAMILSDYFRKKEDDDEPC